MRNLDVIALLCGSVGVFTANPARAQTGSAPVSSETAEHAPSEELGVRPWQSVDALGLSGSVRGGYWTSDRVLDNRHNYVPGSIWLRSTPSLENGFFANAEGWVDREQPLNADPNKKTRGELRESYTGWKNDNITITVGRQIIAWGRADRINPTDVISSRDYTRLFVDDDDERRGSTILTGKYALGDYTLSALWLPEFRPNLFPVPSIPGVVVRQGTDRFVPDQYAAKLERIGHGIDWSLSYFDGINRNPGASITTLTSTHTNIPQITVSAVYNRVRVFGADGATNVGNYGLRGEIAYSQPTSNAGSLFSPHSTLQAVGGLDRNFGGFNVDLQYVIQYIFAYNDPGNATEPVLSDLAIRAALIVNQKTRLQHGPTLRVGYTTLNDALTLEIAGAAFISDGSYFIRPRVSYALSDAIRLTAGGDIFNGPNNSFFGQLHHNTTLLSEVKYSF